MTAQRGDGVTRRATTREELIADMPREWTTQLVRDRVADALVPTVDAMIAAAVASELRERAGMVRARAAEEEDDLPAVADALHEVASWLNARAAALAPEVAP